MNTTSRTATPTARIRATFAAGLVAVAVCAGAAGAVTALTAHTQTARTPVTASGFGWDAPAPSDATPAASPSASTDPNSGFGWE